MHALHASLAPLVIAAGVAGAWHAIHTQRFAPQTAQTMTRNGPILPLAALAWSQQHCDPKLVPRPGATRVHADDLRRVEAHFDALHKAEGLTAACAGATAIALPTLDKLPPSRRAEALASAALPVR